LNNFFLELREQENFRAKAVLFRSTDFQNPRNPGTHFRQCNVTFIGGVSGSILEQIAFADANGIEVDEDFALTLMSVLVLAGHHSLSEAYTTTQRYFDVMGKIEDTNFAKVDAPLSLDEGCKDIREKSESELENGNEYDTEGKFLADFGQMFLPIAEEDEMVVAQEIDPVAPVLK
jgi:hypothetical protein